MRRSPTRTLVALALVALLPWCLCRLGLAACAFPTATPAEAAALAPSCCGGCCGTANAHDAKPPEAPSQQRHGDDCPSPCCAPKVAPAAESPEVPVDGIGVIPCWLDSWRAGADLEIASTRAPRIAPALLDTGPPGAPDSGRAVLAATGRLLI